jgi:hypothetical protein
MTKVDKRSGTFGRLMVGEVYHADNEKYRGRTLGEVAKHEGKEVYIYMHLYVLGSTCTLFEEMCRMY